MFNNNVFGPVTSAPAIIYNDTNMSSDNISCTNLSGSIATFDQLQVVTFNPISFSADYADITNLSCDNLSCQFKSTFGSISTGNISGTDISLTGDLNASEVNASEVNASDVYADNISSGTITGVSNISTPVLYNQQLYFMDPTRTTITSSIVSRASEVLYQLGSQDYKIRSVTGGTEYLTCDSTLGNTNISNLSVDNLSVTASLTASNIKVSNLIESENLSVKRADVVGIDFTNSGDLKSFLDVNAASLKWMLKKSLIFHKDTDTGLAFCKIDHARSNINISNLSVANISTNLLNNISAGENITLSTEAVTNKLVITSTGGLNSSNLSLDNLSTEAVSVEEIQYRNNPAGVKSYVQVNTGSVKQYHYSSWQFQKDNDAGIVFMKIDYAAENINISNLSVANLSYDFSQNLSAGTGISITQVGDTAVIENTGIATDPLNLSKLNVSNISCDEGITTDTITCDLTPNLTAGAGVAITSVGNKPVISGVNSVSANVSVSDFIETLQIIPSGTNAFVNQGVGQGSQLISVYDYQGGTPYTAANLFTVNAGDKIHFNWKQSGWVQTSPGQQSYVICYIVKGTNAIPQAGDRIEVGRIYQYIYSQSDHEEIAGSFVYNVTSTFSFYRSQMEGAPNLVTQGQDYGAATATVYRATVPNSISVPTLIDATNISVDNLSVTASLTASNIKVSNLIESENISVKRVDVVGIDFTNSGDLKSFLDVNAASLKWMLKKSLIFHKDTDAGLAFCKIDYARSNINISNLSTTNVSSVELSLSTLRLKDSTQATKASWFVYPTAMEIYTVNDFRIRNQGVTGSPDFMFMDTSRNNVNISNLSVSHFDVEFVDLSNNLSDGKGINITSSAGKAVISLQDPVNISTITTENMNVSGSAANFFDGANIFGTATVTNLVSDLTNTLSAGTNITITSVGGKAQISSTGGGGSVPANLSIDNLSVTADVTIGGDLECDLTNTLSAGSNITITSVGGKAQISASGGGSVPANLSIDNLSVNFDATIGGDLKMLSADIIATSSELFIQDVTCTRNMSVSNAFGANTIAASTTLTVGTNATVTGNITASVGDITATTGTVFAPNVSGTIVTAGTLNVFNDASITRDLQVQRYFDSGRPRFMMLSRTTALGQTGAGERLMVFNTNSTGQVAGEFGVTNGGEIQVTTGGWYRLSWSIGFIRASGGDRYSFRAYNTTRTNAGNWTFDGLKDRIGSVGYCRSSSLNRECVSVGTVLRYIPANGWARIVIGAMIQSSSNFASSFNGTNLRASSNFMIEFVSSASET